MHTADPSLTSDTALPVELLYSPHPSDPMEAPPPDGMSPDARKALSATIRRLRESLLAQLEEASEARFRWQLEKLADAGLKAGPRAERAHIESWCLDQCAAQGLPNVEDPGDVARRIRPHRMELVKLLAATTLNRFVLLRVLECTKGPDAKGKPQTLVAKLILSPGREAGVLKAWSEFLPELSRSAESPSADLALFFRLLWDELAIDLPGLYGPLGVADLLPVPPPTLRGLVEALTAPALDTCWTDPLLLGWVYQYWNDPEREALDDKINKGGKIEPHEVASKTQMFTERYMVDWLLQNSLGTTWLAICKKNGWTPEAQGTLVRLEARRADWRARRAAGSVALIDKMPLFSAQEARWAYLVPQPIRVDAHTPSTLRGYRVLDPAMGSGHFLVVAFELLFALHQEEARHWGRSLIGDDRAIVAHILSENLHGIDLDPRAVQIAAAALYLQARRSVGLVHLPRMNLVAANLRLGGLRVARPADPSDPEERVRPEEEATEDNALKELIGSVESEVGLAPRFTRHIVRTLHDADQQGSLLRVGETVDKALQDQAEALRRPTQGAQLSLFADSTLGAAPTISRRHVETPQKTPEQVMADARDLLVARLEKFLDAHSTADDLGLRFWGQQLTAGVRFLRMVAPDQYDLVVANPPYQGSSKLAQAGFLVRDYTKGKADLFAAFLLRGLELVRPGGLSAMLTMRNWMFIKQYSGLREHLLEQHTLRALGDFDRGAFEDVPDEVVSVAVSVFQRTKEAEGAVALCPTPREDTARDAERTPRKRAATLCQEGRVEFEPTLLRVVPEWPLVYWWSREFLTEYSLLPKFGELLPARQGLSTGDNTRFLRSPWEVQGRNTFLERGNIPCDYGVRRWVPLVKGAAGRKWCEAPEQVVDWANMALAMQVSEIGGAPRAFFRNERYYFRTGVAFTTTGATFAGRVFAYSSIFEAKGRSVFSERDSEVVCLLNSKWAKDIIGSLNPTIDFTVGDVNRLPFVALSRSDEIYSTVANQFGVHEAHREPSVEFKRPGPSPWEGVQVWAQLAVDRPAGAPLPEYVPVWEAEEPWTHLSFALGVALGRFGAAGEGVLDPRTADLSACLPAGLLFLDGSLSARDLGDSLGHPAAAPLWAAFDAWGERVAPGRSLRDWLMRDFFVLHRKMYENRPIHWPLSSEKGTFVAWVNIHRMDARTLKVLLVDHLSPRLKALDGMVNDARATFQGEDKKQAREAEKRAETLRRQRAELESFARMVQTLLETGAPASEGAREVDAPWEPVLDDGVMINAAGLWPLLDPVWKDPKTWWKELVSAKGRKDYDWSHLARRYWPERVAKKCAVDPSLAVAHGCFWAMHPEKAWAWELRLQQEIAPGFRIVEGPWRRGPTSSLTPDHHELRATFLREQPAAAREAVAEEARRRMKKDRRAIGEAFTLPLIEEGLWSADPLAMWRLEERLCEFRYGEVQVSAPDAGAREALLATQPQLVQERAALLRKLRAKLEKFKDELLARLGPEEDEAEAGDEGEEA